MMTASLAAEVAAEGILANCVAPGFIDTELMRDLTTEEDRARLAPSATAPRAPAPRLHRACTVTSLYTTPKGEIDPLGHPWPTPFSFACKTQEGGASFSFF